MLPFLAPPCAQGKRVLGTPASGTIEMCTRGGLTVNESATIASLLADQPNTFVKAAQTADLISKTEEISLEEAFGIVEQSASGVALEPKANEIRLRHASSINSVAKMLVEQGDRNMRATVTSLIQHRCNLPDCSLADTGTLHQDLFMAIWDLASEEQASENLETSPPSAEDLGKPQQASGKRGKPTGLKSSTT